MSKWKPKPGEMILVRDYKGGGWKSREFIAHTGEIPWRSAKPIHVAGAEIDDE